MKKLLLPYLIFSLSGMAICPSPVLAQQTYHQTSPGIANLDENTVLDGNVHVPHGTQKINTLSYTHQNIKDVLHDLAEEGQFNLIMDDSVSGNVTLELSNVTLDQALQAVANLGDLLILPQRGNIFMAITRSAASTKGVSRQLSKLIPIRYTNATRIATLLNQTVFSSSGGSSSGGSGASSGSSGGGGSVTKVKADLRSNSIMVLGTAQEIAVAQAAVEKLDLPRKRKTFYLSNANALDVATMLASSVFNDGTANIKIGNAGSSGTATPSLMKVERQDLSEGSGINQFGTSSAGSSGGLSASITLRGYTKTTDSLSVSPEGVLLIPDSRQNSLTIMGTAQQIATAESLIPTLDAQLPQVAIEASLIEITDTNGKTFAPQWGTALGDLQSGFNNQPVEGTLGGVMSGSNGLIGLRTVDAADTDSKAGSGLIYTSSPVASKRDYLFQLKTLVSKNRAKILANPTIVASHDTESVISIVDEILRRVTTTVSDGVITTTNEIGEVGIVLDILPKIGEDGTISMRLRPCVTTPLEEVTSGGHLVVTLVSKRDLMTQNLRVRDGQTLVIGGLIQQNETLASQKFPGLGDLPIVSAMFRASQKNGKRSELVLMITPHIINKSKLAPIHSVSSDEPIPTGFTGGE